MTINELSMVMEQSNETTSQSMSLLKDQNGLTTASSSLTGCESSLSVSESLVSGNFMMPAGIVALGPNNGSAGASIGVGVIGDIIIPAPVVPYDPSPVDTINARDQKTEYEYDESGALASVVNYLGLETSISRDVFGRVASETNPYGRVTEYTYNLTSLTTEMDVEGIGTFTLTRNDIGMVTSVSDPIKGTLSYTYNVRGDVLTSPDGSFSYDILGRTTDVSYTGGGEDDFSYTPEGWLDTLSDCSFAYDTLGNQTTWNDGTNAATISYTGSNGSTALGLKSAISGSGDISDYSFVYNTKHWLSQFTETDKSQTFSYVYNTDGTLSSIINPNQTNINKTYSNKALDTLTVIKGENTYLETDATYGNTSTNQDKLIAYDYSVYAGQGQTFSESYGMTYDALQRIEELEYGSNSRTLTYSYSASVGQLTSILDSALNDSYDFAYDSKGRLSTVTYPGVQGTSGYTYDDQNDQGRLQQVTYPGSRTMSLDWDGRGRITTISLNDNGTVTEYGLSFNDLNQVKRILHKVDGLTIRSWNFSYGPLGLDKILVKDASNNTILTQDITTDVSGTPVSMTYTPNGYGGSSSGEKYFYYDPCKDMVMMADSSGNPEASWITDRNNHNYIDAYNPNGLINIIGIGGDYTFPGFGDDLIRIPKNEGPIGVVTSTAYSTNITETGAQLDNASQVDCGEIGLCGGGLGSADIRFQRCCNRCFALGGVENMEKTTDSAVLDFGTIIDKPTFGSESMNDADMEHKTSDFNVVAENIEQGITKAKYASTLSTMGAILEVVSTFIGAPLLLFIAKITGEIGSQAWEYAQNDFNDAYDAWWHFKSDWKNAGAKGFRSLWDRRKDCREWCSENSGKSVEELLTSRS